MERPTRTWQIGSLALGAALLLTASGNAQVGPENRAGLPDPGQTQRERTPVDLSPIDKPRPEVEIFTSPDMGSATPKGIVIVPDEAAQTPTPPPTSAKEPPSPEKKKDDY